MNSGAICHRVVLILWALGFTCSASASPKFNGPSEIQPVGKHYPVFRLEKSENAQNVMVTFVKLNDKCQIVDQSENDKIFPLGFYWLLDRVRYKVVHPLIQRGIRKRLELVSMSADRRDMVLRINNLKELNQKVTSADIKVSTRKAGSDCSLDGILSVNGEKMRLEKIYSETTTTIIPPFRKLKALTVTGQTLIGDHRVVRRYSTR